jgi:hypothetical protein
VRDGQLGQLAHLVAVHEQVDVDRVAAPSAARAPVAAEQRLELERRREQRLRTDRRPRPHDEVEVVVLRHVARIVRGRPRRRRVDGRDLLDGDAVDVADQLDRGGQLRHRVTDVRTEPEQHRECMPGDGHRVRRSVTATSASATGTGACGLWTVTVAATTAGRARQTSASRVASRSIRS